MNKRVHVLFGVTNRDPMNEHVCQFFRTKKDRKEFARDLPGRYTTMTLSGIGYDDFDIEGDIVPPPYKPNNEDK